MRTAKMMLSASVVLGAGCVVEDDLHTGSTSAAVTVEADGWRHVAQFELAGARGAHFNPIDGAVYALSRGKGTADGLYRFDADGAVTKIAFADRPAALAVDPVSGDIFVMEDFAGRIYRSAFGTTGRALWVSGFHWGDDDPVGAAIAGPDYLGDVVSPGQGIVVDRGYAGPKELWRFSVSAVEGEVRLRGDDGTLHDPVDVAIGREHVYVADQAAGAIYELTADGSLHLVGSPVPTPVGLAVDPSTGDLFVLDMTFDEVVRFDTDTGEVVRLFGGLDIGVSEWTGIDVSAAGDRVVVTDSGRNEIHVFERDHAPVAVCADRTVVVEDACEADVSIDDGSYDPEGEPVDIAVSPEGLYPLGTTDVTLSVSDSGGQSASCTGTVTVEPAGELLAQVDDVGDNRQGIWATGGMFCQRPARLAFVDTRLTVYADGTAHLWGTAVVIDSGCQDGEHDEELWSVDVWMDAASPPQGRPAVDTRYFALREGQARLSQSGGDGHVDFESRNGRQQLAVLGSDGDGLAMTGEFFYPVESGGRGRTRSGSGEFQLYVAPMCGGSNGE